MKPEQFIQALKKQGIHLDDTQQEQFSIYFQTLITWNQKMNLTTLTDEAEVYLKHFYDSISAAFYYDFSDDLSVCDVGAGAGFPGIPLKICFPDLQLTIVDSLKKRIHFLNHLLEKLHLNNVQLYHDRAENFGQNKSFRESFDCVISRAVGRMQVLSELCLPLVKANGDFVAMKGAQAKNEVKDAEQALKTLGGNLKRIDTFQLPEEASERSIITIHKVKKTPKKYPRQAGLPNKNPL